MVTAIERATDTRYDPYFKTPESETVQYRSRCIRPKPEGPPGPTNWSLKQLEESAFRRRLYEELGDLKEEANLFLAPTVEYLSGVMLRKSEFTRDIPLGSSGPHLRRPEKDRKADGVWLDPGDGFLMSAGGCPVIILTTPNGNCGVAHAALDSLIDPYLVHHEQGREPHPYPSIIDAMVETAMRTGVHPTAMTLRAFYAVPWQSFRYSKRDPIYGIRNSRLHIHMQTEGFGQAIITHEGHEHVCVDTLIWLQAKKRRIGTIEVNRTLPYNGKFPYVTNQNPDLTRDSRSLIIVTRSR